MEEYKQIEGIFKIGEGKFFMITEGEEIELVDDEKVHLTIKILKQIFQDAKAGII